MNVPGPRDGRFGFALLKQLAASPMALGDAMVERYGDAVQFRIANLPVFLLAHPKHHFAVLVEKSRAFAKPRRLNKVLAQWNGNGLVVNDGDSWVRQRRRVNPAFRHDRLAGFVETAGRHTHALAARWSSATEVDATRDISALTLATVAEGLFGEDVKTHVAAFCSAVETLNELGAREVVAPILLPRWAPTPQKRRLNRAIRSVDTVVRSMIEGHRGKPDQGDLLSMLLAAVDSDGDGAAMSEEQVRDECVTLTLAGNETTATALIWTLHALSAHPEAQERARAEEQERLGDRSPTLADLPHLRFLEWCVKEAMRLYPPAYILSREARETVTVEGIEIPRRAQVNLLVHRTQRDARWFSSPERFMPQRFEREAEWPRGSYLPFGLGPRACIGRGLAMVEMVTVLSILLRRLRMAPSGPPVELEAQVSLHPRGGLRLRVQPVS